MPNNDISKCSDELILAAPQRSAIYRVDPKQIDGRYHECLSSYLSNTAAEHGTSPNIFLNDIIGVAAHEFLDNRRGSFAAKPFAQSLDGTTDFAVRFAQMISRLSGGVKLRKNTLEILAPITSRRGFLRSELAWSPTFLEALTKPFIPILWRLQWIKVCSRFRTPLQLRCPECGRPVNVLSGRGNIGYCTHYSCQADLSAKPKMTGAASSTAQSYKSMDYEVWVSDQTETLMDSLRNNPLPDDYSVSETLQFWFNSFELNGTRGVGPKYFGVQGNSIGTWLRGEAKPKVEHLFNFAWVFQLGIDDFLRRKIPDNHDGKLTESLALLPKEGQGSPKRRIDHAYIGRRLREILQNDEFYYASFKEIAEGFDHTAGSLRGAFPEEAKKLAERYRMNKHIRARLRTASDMAEIAEACSIIAEMGQVISSRRVKSMISKPSLVVNPKLGGALIKEARRRQIENERDQLLAKKRAN